MPYETIAEMYQAWYEGIRKAPVWREEEYKHARRLGLEQEKAYMAMLNEEQKQAAEACGNALARISFYEDTQSFIDGFRRGARPYLFVRSFSPRGSKKLARVPIFMERG